MSAVYSPIDHAGDGVCRCEYRVGTLEYYAPMRAPNIIGMNHIFIPSKYFGTLNA
jgi:hypothetical protein